MPILLTWEGCSISQSHLERLPYVKDVHLERQLKLALQSLKFPALPPESFEHCNATYSETPCVAKRPRRLQTRPTFSLEGNLLEWELDDGSHNGTLSKGSRRRLSQTKDLATTLGADALWAKGYRGQGVRMGVFDTGIKEDHPDVKHIEERTNWTHEPTLDDGLGHGSFVAGVVAGSAPACLGLAPEVSLFTFRVFTNDQVSFTSWFLDAFNYAIATEIDVVNLSIGGPDYLDRPFVEKVAEVTGAGIVMVSAIGNDGPHYGTLNNPADQNDVLGVGGVDWDGSIAGFSSRGMSTWELPLGYGRSKPDVMAYGKDVQGSRITGGCRSLSGTSVASPVVAGAVCLLASTMTKERRRFLNPASMKQALVESAIRSSSLNMYEQGAGMLNVVGAYEVLAAYEPRVSIVPAILDLTECPYAWPFCRQPLYAGAMPMMFNATILNGMGVVGEFNGAPTWQPDASSEGGRFLDVRFDWWPQLWPWSGNLAVYLRVKPEGADFTGKAKGTVTFTVTSPPGPGESAPRQHTVVWPIIADIVPTPPRTARILWDQFHSIAYPPVYLPRDDLGVKHDILDWNGDHPHTNFNQMYNFLRDKGYFLEILASPATCFDASVYGALMIVDPEEEFYPEEVAKLTVDVEEKGLGLVIFADWYDVDTIEKMRFYDDNTRSWWEAATGGANVPALNDLLKPFGAAFVGGSHDLRVEVPGIKGPWYMSSGSAIGALPEGGFLFNGSKEGQGTEYPVLGVADVGSGRLVLYGDSNCLDSSHMRIDCFDLLEKTLAYVAKRDDRIAAPLLAPPARISSDFGLSGLDVAGRLPSRRNDLNFTEASFVLRNPIKCYRNAPLEHQGQGYHVSLPSTVKATGRDAGVPDVPMKMNLDSTSTALDDSHTSESTLGERQPDMPSPLRNEIPMGSSSYQPGGGVLATSGPWQERLVGLSLPTSWGGGMMHNAQLFSIGGGVVLVVLWSLARRRRVALANGAPARRGTSLLPLFWRHSARVRRE